MAFFHLGALAKSNLCLVKLGKRNLLILASNLYMVDTQILKVPKLQF